MEDRREQRGPGEGQSSGGVLGEKTQKPKI